MDYERGEVRANTQLTGSNPPLYIVYTPLQCTLAVPSLAEYVSPPLTAQQAPLTTPRSDTTEGPDRTGRSSRRCQQELRRMRRRRRRQLTQ